MPLPPTSKPPYLLGLLCLIPFVGGFVGLGLLLYGLLKYKDKWLAIIGAFGILFTVGIYSFLFYYMINGELSKKGFTEISQMQLNNLVKNIEFYKMQHGQYPERLQELQTDDKFAPINDPIQLTRFRQNLCYNYEKVGDKYLLFSSGLDGKPNTNDDLFPEIFVTDTSKIGLIKRIQ